MNRLERAAYKLLLEFPKLKSYLTSIYKTSFYLVPFNAEVSNLTEKWMFKNCFFGFHDKSPWSTDNEKILYHEYTGNSSTPIRPKGIVTLGIIDNKSGEKKSLSSTSACNWQQGAMLQWRGSNKEIVFHDILKERVITRLVNEHGENVSQFPFPILSITHDGDKALVYDNFYHGYVEKQYSYLGINKPNNEISRDIWLLDFRSGTIDRILEWKLLEEKSRSTNIRDAKHYISHAQFSPCSEKISFFLRTKKSQNRHKTRLFILDTKTHDLTEAMVSDYVSHYCWYRHSRLLVYAKCLTGSYGYFIVDVNNGHIERLDWVNDQGDGHPQFARDTNLVVTDTYTDRFGFQTLHVLDMKAKKTKLLFKHRIPLAFRGDRRCDFHPRWDRSGKYISVDTAASGTRSLGIYRL